MNSLLNLHRLSLLLLSLGLLVLGLLYGAAGEAKGVAFIKWMDVVGEGGSALFASAWLLLILSGRPRGLVSRLLALGMGGIILSLWADVLDEFWVFPAAQLWDNWLESLLMPAGMLLLTAALFFWRQEQLVLSEHMQKRERLFRDHRVFDRLTQLASAAYLREQIALERARAPSAPCGVILLDVDDFHRINRELGYAEGDRLLQALSQLLLLNLRDSDLLCRYAGDRFAVLLPETPEFKARAMAAELAAAIGHFRYRAGRDGRTVLLSVRVAAAQADDSPEGLLARLNQALERLQPAGLATV